jgi:pseudouridylate synthase / pseudouridine kinase
VRLGYPSSLIRREQETLGVPVVTYGETQDFPAFYSPSSGYKVGLRLFQRYNILRSAVAQSPWRINDPGTAANVLCTWSMRSCYASFLNILTMQVTQWGLGMTNGVLFGVPIPEPYAAAGKQLQEAVERAVQESQVNGMDKRGKDVTPWLLERVRELTSGKSLASSRCSSTCRLCPNNIFIQIDIALIENTAVKGAQIAVAYAKLIEQHRLSHVTDVRL